MAWDMKKSKGREIGISDTSGKKKLGNDVTKGMERQEQNQKIFGKK